MSVLLQLVQLLPSILAAIKSVEDVVGAGKGQSKKQVVLSAVTAAAQAGEHIPQPTVAAISTVIDTVVGIFNASGVFQHGTPTPTVTPSAPAA